MKDRKEMYKQGLETEISQIDNRINELNRLISMHLSKIEEYKTSLDRISTDEYRSQLIELDEKRISAGKITIEEIDRRIASAKGTKETLIKMEEGKITILKNELKALEQKRESLRIKIEELDQKTPKITPNNAAKNALQQGATTEMANNAKTVEKELLNPEHNIKGVTKDD